MCAVSMVRDWGMHKWRPYELPQPTQFPPTQPYDGPTRKEWEDFKELIKRAMEYDKRTGQEDCVNPHKTEWMKQMSKFYDEKFDAPNL